MLYPFFSPFRYLAFRSFSSLNSTATIIKSLRTQNNTPESLLKTIAAYPSIVKLYEFQEILQISIKTSQTNKPFLSPCDIMLVRMLLTYSKFVQSEYDWKGIIRSSLQNSEGKISDLYDLSIKLSIYYDALRRYFEIKGRENDFFKNIKELKLKEKEYNLNLSFNFKNFKNFFNQYFEKNLEEKLYYEIILENFFGNLNSIANFDEKKDEIAYFVKIFLNFEFPGQKFKDFVNDLLVKGFFSINDITQIYLILFRKQNFLYANFFSKYLDDISNYIRSGKEIYITKANDPHHLYLDIKFLKQCLKEDFPISIDLYNPKDRVTSKSLIDLYWILTRNYFPNYEEILNLFKEVLEKNMKEFCLKDLIIFLVSNIYANLNKKDTFSFKDKIYKDLIKEISNRISLEQEMVDILSIKTFGGSFFQSLKYLSIMGLKDVVDEAINEEIMLFLSKNWIIWTRTRKVSNSEKIIRKNLKELVKKYNMKINFGAYLGEMYYCDILIGEIYIIEINGDHHYNIFYKKNLIKDQNYRYLGNFLLKKSFLWNKGFIVSEINSDDYLKFLYDKEKLNKFLSEYLENLLKKKT